MKSSLQPRIPKYLPVVVIAGASFLVGFAITRPPDLGRAPIGAAEWIAALPASLAAVTVLAGALAAAGLLVRRVLGTRPEAAPALALEAAGIGTREIDPETGMLSCDARARDLLGLTERRCAEADWLARMRPEDRTEALDQTRRARGSGRSVAILYRVTLPDGRTRWIEDMLAPIPGGRLIALLRDVTEQREAAERLRLRQGQAEATAEETARFLAVMSHEIRTPMTCVLGMLDLLTDEPDARTRAERLEIARRSAGALLAILNDVLAFSRAEGGRFELRPVPTEPGRLVAEVMDMMLPRVEPKGVALDWTIAPDVPERVLTDPGRIRQILVNLVGNAAKFTDQGEIALRVERADAPPGRMALAFEVRDSGVGMAPDVLERVFDRFVRDESAGAGREAGTGLGLAISRHLAQLMGGTIEMTSAPGAGSVARFVIPVERADAPAREAPPAEESTEAPGPLRVLVAEDNATNRYLVRALLEREGHEVTTVADGIEAVAAADQGFDVILMDVQMPRMDGATATRAIRTSGLASARTPIIALTANALAADRRIYLSAGMSDYVSKPIELAALNGALARAARSRRARAEAERPVSG
ncbi:ATP-binding protein [Amaricoccus solimangrovi]|nr:ATP-binding protein [Amaricoccus solimangrovi]